MTARDGNGTSGAPPGQLHMWEGDGEATELATLEADGTPWKVLLLIDRPERGLVRGRLSYRHEDERFDTAPILVEETEDEVIRRARAFSASTLRQFFASVRA